MINKQTMHIKCGKHYRVSAVFFPHATNIFEGVKDKTAPRGFMYRPTKLHIEPVKKRRKKNENVD